MLILSLCFDVRVFVYVEPVEFLKLSDELRDQTLPGLGVMLEDRQNGKPMIKLASQAEIQAERDRKKQVDLEKQKKKEELARQAALKRREKLELGRVAPVDLWKADPAFTKLDDKVGC